MSTLPFISPQILSSDRRVRVVIVGAGGNGSQMIDGLARLDRAIRAQLGAGFDATVYDPDVVSPANIGRQRFSSQDCGFNKAVLMTHRVNNFYDLDWEAEPCAFNPSSHPRADLIVTCVDQGAFRHTFGAHNAESTNGALWLDLGNGADTGQVVLGHVSRRIPAGGLRLPNVYDLYGAELLAGDKDDQPSCSLAEALQRQRWSVNAITVSAALSILDGLFFSGGLSHHGALVRIAPISIVPLMIDPARWTDMGLPVQ